MRFSSWLESRMFEIPPEAKNLLPTLNRKVKELDQNWIGKEKVGELNDPFTGGKIPIYLMDTNNYHKLGLKGQGAFVNSPPSIYYRIPMYDFDTIYHELTHAYDPRYRKGIGKTVIGPLGQTMTTPHEQLAVTSARMNAIKDATPQEKEELKNWLRHVKTEDDLETENLPRLLNNMSLFMYFRNPRLWRQFTSRLWHAISS